MKIFNQFFTPIKHSEREGEDKQVWHSIGNFQPILLTFEEHIADHAHVGNFPETFIILALCFNAWKFTT